MTSSEGGDRCRTLHDLVAKCASRHPDEVCLVFDTGHGEADSQERMTYSQLWQQAVELKLVFESLSVTEQIVGVLLVDGISIPSVLLGLLLSCCAFHPFNTEGLHYTCKALRQAGASLILAHSELSQQLKPLLTQLKGIEVPSADLSKHGLQLFRIVPRSVLSVPSVQQFNLAYSITTSGTTSAPKVVLVPHACILPNIIDLRELFQLGIGDRVLLTSPLTFDPSIIDIFCTLSSGACLVIVPTEVKRRPEKLLDVVHFRQDITVMQATPTLIRNFSQPKLQNTLLGPGTALRVLALGGEQFPPRASLASWVHADNQKTQFYNLYGVTEVSCWASCKHVDVRAVIEEEELVSLGEALSETVLKLVADEAGAGTPCSDGEGDIWIGSHSRICLIDVDVCENIAKGRHSQVNKNTSIVWRNTGDRGKLLEDGSIICLGRRDDQVKRHCKRLSLEALEMVCKEVAGILDCTAVLDKLNLMVFIIPDLPLDCHMSQSAGGVSAAYRINDRPVDHHSPDKGHFNVSAHDTGWSLLQQRLSAHIEDSLPSHYMPTTFVKIAGPLPLTQNGKLDTKQLLSVGYEELKASVEAKDLWYLSQQVWRVNLPDVVIQETSNFISLGGDSLSAVRVVNNLETLLGCSLPVLLDVLVNRDFHHFVEELQSIRLSDDSLAQARLSDPSQPQTPVTASRLSDPCLPQIPVTASRLSDTCLTQTPSTVSRLSDTCLPQTPSTISRDASNSFGSSTVTNNINFDNSAGEKTVYKEEQNVNSLGGYNKKLQLEKHKRILSEEWTGRKMAKLTDISTSSEAPALVNSLPLSVDLHKECRSLVDTHNLSKSQQSLECHRDLLVVSSGSTEGPGVSTVSEDTGDRDSSKTLDQQTSGDDILGLDWDVDVAMKRHGGLLPLGTHSRRSSMHQKGLQSRQDNPELGIGGKALTEDHTGHALPSGTSLEGSLEHQGRQNSKQDLPESNGATDDTAERQIFSYPPTRIIQRGSTRQKYCNLLHVDPFEIFSVQANICALRGSEDDVMESDTAGGCSLTHTLKSVLGLTLKWKFDTKKCVDASPLIVERGVVIFMFIGSHSGQFSAINIHTGHCLWSVTLPDRIESSACCSLCGSYVIVGCYDGMLYVINATSGFVVWKFQTGDMVKCSPVVDDHTGHVLCGSHDGYLYCLDVNEKFCAWKCHLGGGSVFSSPAVDTSARLVYAASLGGKVLGICADSGTVRWAYDLKKPVFSSLCVIGHSVLVGCVDGKLHCLSSLGHVEWTFSTQAPVFSTPVTYKSSIILGSHDCHVYCLTDSGQQTWTFQASSPVYSTAFVSVLTRSTDSNQCSSTGLPLGSSSLKLLPDHARKVPSSIVVVAETKGTLYVLSYLDGQLQAEVRLPGEIFSSPVVVDNFIIVGCRDNFVYCFEIT